MIDQLFETGILSGEQLLQLLEHVDEESSSYLFEKARIRQRNIWPQSVYQRINWTDKLKMIAIISIAGATGI